MSDSTSTTDAVPEPAGPAADTAASAATTQGLSLAPFRGFRPRVAGDRLGRLLCPPYDVIDAAAREQLLDADPDNAVSVILPEPSPEGYAAAASQLRHLAEDGTYATDDTPSLYVYEMRTPDGSATRGLLGAVELRDPQDGVILPHENTMAGPVADRLAVMTATDADLEPIYLVYDGGGAASEIVREADAGGELLASATTPDGVAHRLWAVRDAASIRAVEDDLAGRRALIADGHHRYATYRERQRLTRETSGPGPADRGLALLVDSTDYGPQVHAIHRVLPDLRLIDAVQRLQDWGRVEQLPRPDAITARDEAGDFAIVLTDGTDSYLFVDERRALASITKDAVDLGALADLDVTVVHHGIVEKVWGLHDDEATVRYAHTEQEADELARRSGGTAILLRPTPVAAVAAVAAAGARMPRKSTLFTPKPASGLVIRRLGDS